MEFDSLVNQDLRRVKRSVAGNMDGSVLLMVNDMRAAKADRRKADLALQKSEERYRAFVEHSSEAVWCLDVEPPCSITLSVNAQIDHFYEHGWGSQQFMASSNKVAGTSGFIANRTKALHSKSICRLRKSSQTWSQIPAIGPIGLIGPMLCRG